MHTCGDDRAKERQKEISWHRWTWERSKYVKQKLCWELWCFEECIWYIEDIGSFYLDVLFCQIPIWASTNRIMDAGQSLSQLVKVSLKQSNNRHVGHICQMCITWSFDNLDVGYLQFFFEILILVSYKKKKKSGHGLWCLWGLPADAAFKCSVSFILFYLRHQLENWPCTSKTKLW